MANDNLQATDFVDSDLVGFVPLVKLFRTSERARDQTTNVARLTSTRRGSSSRAGSTLRHVWRGRRRCRAAARSGGGRLSRRRRRRLAPALLCLCLLGRSRLHLLSPCLGEV